MTQRLRPAVTDPVILMFSRRQVETCDLDEPLQFMRSLTAARQTAHEFCGRISLVVDGYNDDPRELFEIPEVRACIKRLDREWPYWFFFLSQADESIKLLENCLCDAIEVVPGVTSVDMEQLERSLARHFGAMYRLGEELKLPEDMCEEVAECSSACSGMRRWRGSRVTSIGSVGEGSGQPRDQRTPGEKRASQLIWIALVGAAVTALLVARYLEAAG